MEFYSKCNWLHPKKNNFKLVEHKWMTLFFFLAEYQMIKGWWLLVHSSMTPYSSSPCCAMTTIFKTLRWNCTRAQCPAPNRSNNSKRIQTILVFSSTSWWTRRYPRLRLCVDSTLPKVTQSFIAPCCKQLIFFFSSLKFEQKNLFASNSVHKQGQSS